MNSNGRKFECQLEDAPAGFTVVADEVGQQCAVLHNGLDYETQQFVSLRVRVRVQGDEWSSTPTGSGYHSEAMVSMSHYVNKHLNV